MKTKQAAKYYNTLLISQRNGTRNGYQVHILLSLLLYQSLLFAVLDFQKVYNMNIILQLCIDCNTVQEGWYKYLLMLQKALFWGNYDAEKYKSYQVEYLKLKNFI